MSLTKVTKTVTSSIGADDGTAAAPSISFGNDSDTGLYSISANNIGIATGGLNRLKIDSAGRINLDYQPMFHAIRDAGHVTSTGVFIWNNVILNVGSHYNSTTGQFTAPIAGKYLFSMFLLGQSGSNWDVRWQLNGSQYAGGDLRNNAALSSNFTLSSTTLVNMSANDTFRLNVSALPAGNIYGSGLNGFTGIMVG